MPSNPRGGQHQQPKDDHKARPKTGQGAAPDDEDSDESSSQGTRENSGNFANDPDRARDAGRKGGKS